MIEAQGQARPHRGHSPVLVGLLSAIAYVICVQGMHGLGNLISPPPPLLEVDRFTPEVVPLGLVCAVMAFVRPRPVIVWTTIGLVPQLIVAVLILRTWTVDDPREQVEVGLSVLGALLGSLLAAKVVVSSYTPARPDEASGQGQ
jgi:MFS superfamily sulfate permease-like transporter